MKFGPVPVAEALGAVLAHSIALPEGRLRKGVRLENAHLTALVAAGVDEVVVARLDSDDLHEDTAAAALAAAVTGRKTALRASEAFTGRANLIATCPGVVQLDAEAISAANLVDPAITVATVAPFHQIRSGGMVATIKIIPYGVKKRAVERACEMLCDAMRVRPASVRTASLIVTEVSGNSVKKGVDAIADRLAGLGVELSETLSCAHDVDSLAGAFGSAFGEVILVLTGSATSDPADTAPAALSRAGGVLERFGMPVDPGNLLFMGRLGDRRVIGLPGSARSPVLHGADWVLSRVVCGIEVTGEDMARMGVGGLLKEIPTRPQPRRARRSDQSRD